MFEDWRKGYIGELGRVVLGVTAPTGLPEAE